MKLHGWRLWDGFSLKVVGMELDVVMSAKGLWCGV